MSFDTFYPDNPWTGIDRNQRDIYWPQLLATFRARSVWRPFVQFAFDMAAVNTGVVHFDEVYDTEPDVTPIPNRAVWLPSRHLDSRRVTLQMEHHGDKLSFHKFDRIVTYWKENGGDLSRLCRGKLGQNMVDYLDRLVRDAFIDAPFAIYCGDASDFNTLEAADLYTPQVGQQVYKFMGNREVPFANNPVDNISGTLMAITTPTVVFDIQDHDRASGTEVWKAVMQYSRPEMALNYEVGAWTGVRYLRTTRNNLFNCGPITHQAQLTVQADPGDGAAATVDSVYTVGQASGVTRYITVDDASGFSVGDIVTLHKTRTSDYGVTNGVDPQEGTARHRRIVNITSNDVSFDKPLLDTFEVGDYVTLALDVHLTSFVAGPTLAAGIGQAPQVYALEPVDDLRAIYRFTWDSYLKYQLYRVEFGEAVYSAGSAYNEWG